jgi:hypothetical protein
MWSAGFQVCRKSIFILWTTFVKRVTQCVPLGKQNLVPFWSRWVCPNRIVGFVLFIWPIICLHVLSSMLWCRITNLRQNDVLLVFALVCFVKRSGSTCYLYLFNFTGVQTISVWDGGFAQSFALGVVFSGPVFVFFVLFLLLLIISPYYLLLFSCLYHVDLFWT